jgi:hypothetical protein
VLKRDVGAQVGFKASDDFSKCFSKIRKDGTIVLMGSSLGQDGSHKDNIAQKIANVSQRTVLATTCPIYPSDTTIQSIKPLILKHPGYSSLSNFLFERCAENNENHFKTFNPEKKT